MLNVAFCDDDNIFLHDIELMVKRIFKTLRIPVSINLFTDVNLLIKKFEQYDPYYDIIFLDIDMPLMNGKEVARKLRLIDRKFKLVFITSYEQEVLNTLQFDVCGFLPKISLTEHMPAVIERAIKAINEENPQNQILKIIKDDKIANIKVPLDDIMYFESISRKIFLHTKRETNLLHGYRFSDIVKQYSNLNFVDIHRTCIVNIKYIYLIDDIEIHLDNGTTLPLSRRKRQNVLDKFLRKICEVTKCENY